MTIINENSLWLTTSTTPRFPELEGDVLADVVVIGGGITGITAASLLQRAGKAVVLLEMNELLRGETGHTTAHLSTMIDVRYGAIERAYGREAARLVMESKRAAIDHIEMWSRGVDCGFERVPGFLFTEREEDLGGLQEELVAILKTGVVASWADGFPLPFPVRGAIRVEDQAQFHPTRYLHAQIDFLMHGGTKICERSRVEDINDGDLCRVITEHGTVVAPHVVVATHVPIPNRLALHTKLAAYRTYAIAYEAPDAELPQGLCWDTETPYHYLRRASIDGKNYLIVGGADHKTGQMNDESARYADLHQYVLARFGVLPERSRWSGQIIEPADGLPYIGHNTNSERVFVAAGFSGTGMTFGTLGGIMTADAVLGHANAWTQLYDATRVRPIAAAKRYLSENVDFPAKLFEDRLDRGEVQRVEEIPYDEGRRMRMHGKMLAVYRDDGGHVHVRSAVCPHLGCYVHWNNAEKSWDCPCHGSRFDRFGELLNGPSVKNLREEPAIVDEIASEKPASL